MNLTFYETKTKLILIKYSSLNELPFLTTNKKINFLNEEINLYKEITKIEKIIEYHHKTEVHLIKKEMGYWRCITSPDKIINKKYQFDCSEEESIDSLEKMMYYIYDKSADDVKRSMNQSFFESEGKILSMNYKGKE